MDSAKAIADLDEIYKEFSETLSMRSSRIEKLKDYYSQLDCK